MEIRIAQDAFNQDFSGSDFTLGQALDVNMKRHPLMSYFSKIRQSVELAFFNIPRRRISSFMDRNGIKRMVGQSIALVRVSRNGVIEKIKIVESNGHSIIDNHWTKIITDSGPYPPIQKLGSQITCNSLTGLIINTCDRNCLT